MLSRTKYGLYEDHRGNGYPTFSKMCKAYNINPMTVRKRLESGMTTEQALTKPVNKHLTSPQQIVYDHRGTPYKNKSQLCKAYGIRLQTFIIRRRRGMSLQEALETPVREKKKSSKEMLRKHLIIDGHEYSSIKEICRIYNQPYQTVISRLKQGWDIMTALTKPVRKTSARGKNKITCTDGIRTYSSLKEMAEALGIKPDTLYHRYNRKTKLTFDRRCKDHYGKVYSSLIEICRSYGISRDAFLKRRETGWDMQSALETPTGYKRTATAG